MWFMTAPTPNSWSRRRYPVRISHTQTATYQRRAAQFVKFGLTQEALESYVPLIEEEVLQYIKTSTRFKGASGTIDIPAAMAEITIFTASRALQGEEVRKKLTADFADLYHDLDLGFSPLNALMPWLPIPSNRKRDAAREKMREVYTEIIKERRRASTQKEEATHDMITNLMRSTYKNGIPVPDKEIAHMMITLLMAGQHSSSSASSWIMLRLASEPRVVEELFAEQVSALGGGSADLPPLRYRDLERLPLHQNVIKETLRVHSSIHSIMRKVKNPLQIPGTQVIVPDSHVLLASPVMTAMSEQYFPNAATWNPHRWDDRKEDEESEDMVDYGYGAVSKGTKSPYLPFGAGRHRCIGEKFAYLNLGVIVATLVREFKFSNPKDREGVPATDYAVSDMRHLCAVADMMLIFGRSLCFHARCSRQWSAGRGASLRGSRGAAPHRAMRCGSDGHRADIQVSICMVYKCNNHGTLEWR